MTEQEARKIIGEITLDRVSGEELEAINIAVKALEKQIRADEIKEYKQSEEYIKECVQRYLKGRADIQSELMTEVAMLNETKMTEGDLKCFAYRIKAIAEKKTCSNGQPCTHPNCKRCGTTHFMSECDYGKEQKNGKEE